MEVEQQLKEYNEQLSDLNQDIEYSTVYLSIDRVEILSPNDTGFGTQLSFAFRNTWLVLLHGLELVLLALIYLLPWIVLAALLFFVIRHFIRKSRNRKSYEKTEGSEPEVSGRAGDSEFPLPGQPDQVPDEKEKR